MYKCTYSTTVSRSRHHFSQLEGVRVVYTRTVPPWVRASFPLYYLPALWAGVGAGCPNLVSDIHNETVQWCRLGATKWNVKRKKLKRALCNDVLNRKDKNLCRSPLFTSFIFNFRAFRLSCIKLGWCERPGRHQVYKRSPWLLRANGTRHQWSGGKLPNNLKKIQTDKINQIGPKDLS